MGLNTVVSHNYIGYKFYANIEFIMIISKMFLIN